VVSSERVSTGFSSERTNLSPFTKDFRGEDHFYVILIVWKVFATLYELIENNHCSADVNDECMICMKYALKRVEHDEMNMYALIN
jgi:hypothetical protein